jgi:hypothetical protein
MRERVEDLGRISVLIRNILDLEVFEMYQGRNKDFVDYVFNLSEDARHDLLRTLIYGIAEIREKLHGIADIADGCDILNTDPDCY